MINIVFIGEQGVLDALAEEQSVEPTESFIERMEDALEAGLLSEDEVILLMKDFIRCK